MRRKVLVRVDIADLAELVNLIDSIQYSPKSGKAENVEIYSGVISSTSCPDGCCNAARLNLEDLVEEMKDSLSEEEKIELKKWCQ
jgi:methyl coenzyme M reductase subunit C